VNFKCTYVILIALYIALGSVCILGLLIDDSVLMSYCQKSLEFPVRDSPSYIEGTKSNRINIKEID
jgi:hypothetical protein